MKKDVEMIIKNLSIKFNKNVELLKIMIYINEQMEINELDSIILITKYLNENN